MTVITYRDGIMAADRQLTDSNGLMTQTTKIFRVNDALIGFCGTMTLAMAAVEWVRSGADPKNIPDFQKTDDFQHLVLVRDRKIWRYQRGATPYEDEGKYSAIGCGGDIAMAAMWCGRGAVDAVHCAIALNSFCGMGIDALMDDQMLTESLPWA